MTKKNWLRMLIFLFVLIAFMLYFSLVFTFPSGKMVRERLNTFYALPENTVDGVYLGTSGVDRYWISQLGYKNKGLACYAITSGHQPLVLAKHLMEEVQKTQDVKFFVVDIRAALQDPLKVRDVDMRRITDNLRFSKNRFSAIDDILTYFEDGGQEIDRKDLSYYIPFVKYHSGWKDMSAKDFYDLYPTNNQMGYFGNLDRVFKKVKMPKTKVTDKRTPLLELNESVLNDLLDYCDTLDADVIFVSSPQSINNDLDQEQFNYAFDLISKRGYKTLNFNTEEMYTALNWNFDTDLYNPGHANFYGAYKYTNWLADYILDNYDISDKRKAENHEDYEVWENAYEVTMNRLKKFDPEYYNEIHID